MKLSAKLLRSTLLEDFPSGSAINYYNEKFYLTGDDATHLLVLNKNYDQIEALQLFDSTEKRIEKSEKVDLEASTLTEIDGVTCLLIFGSASKKKRQKLLIIPFNTKNEINILACSICKTKYFVERISLLGLSEINLEGACLIKDELLLGNRGNRSTQKNHLIIAAKEFWRHQKEANLSCIELLLPGHHEEALGISELCYLPSNDILLITLTSEATDNAYDDGVIGDSYLAWIKQASSKLQNQQINAEGMINLTEIDAVFKQHKVEGLCVEYIQDNMISLHMVSDNDTGSTRLFNIQITLDTFQS